MVSSSPNSGGFPRGASVGTGVLSYGAVSYKVGFPQAGGFTLNQLESTEVLSMRPEGTGRDARDQEQCVTWPDF